MAKSRNKFDKPTKTSCTYQLTFNPSCSMQTMQVHQKALECIFSIMICNLEGSRPDMKKVGSLMFMPSIRTLVQKAQAWGEYERGMAPSHQGGTGGLPRKNLDF